MTYPDDGRIPEAEAIRRYGLTPDLLAMLTPQYKQRSFGRADLKLYNISEIEALLNKPEAQPLIERAKAKKAAAAKANKTKLKAKVEAAIKDIKVDKLSLSLIINEAEEEFQNELPAGMHTLEPIEGFEDNPEPDPNDPVIRWLKLKKACSYILKHLVTFNYEWYYAGIGPDSNIYGSYRRAVLDRIAEVYPELRDECSRRKVWQR